MNNLEKQMSVLNPTQLQAVTLPAQSALILAGAGSGKTSVLTTRMAWLISTGQARMPSILAVTFTNKAAKEMVERVAKIMDGKPQKGLTISTFHSFGVRFLRDEAKHLNLKEKFSILDQDDCFSILQELCATTDKALIKTMQSTISLWKTAASHPSRR